MASEIVSFMKKQKRIGGLFRVSRQTLEGTLGNNADFGAEKSKRQHGVLDIMANVEGIDLIRDSTFNVVEFLYEEVWSFFFGFAFVDYVLFFDC